MAWIFRLLSIVAAAITSLLVARDALNFSIMETLVTVTLIVAFGVAAVGWTIGRHG
jgi:hypothetical protein